MERKIYCMGCDAYLGTIRDALLKKDIQYVCDECANPIPESKTDSFDLPDIFKTLFRGKI